MNYPKVCVEAGALFVEFAQVEERSVGQPIRMIVDFGQDGEVLGIEIINLTLSAGENSLAAIEGSIPTEGKGLKYSYDDESDSFYLCLKTSRSSDQKAVQGSMFLDRNGSISALSAEWKSMEQVRDTSKKWSWGALEPPRRFSNGNIGPHVHFESIGSDGRTITENSHVGITNPIGLLNMRLMANILNSNDPSKVKHYAGLPPELTDGKETRRELAGASFLVIEEGPDGILLLRYGIRGDFGGDTWHLNVDDAKHQASYEYGNAVGEWADVPPEVGDVVAYGLGGLASAQQVPGEHTSRPSGRLAASMDYPKVCVEAGALFVEFAQVERTIRRATNQNDCGLRQDGEVLGIELIKSNLSAGENGLAAIEGSIPTDGSVQSFSHFWLSFLIRKVVG